MYNIKKVLTELLKKVKKNEDDISNLNSKTNIEYIDTSTITLPLDDSSTVVSFAHVGKNIYITFRGKPRTHSENEVFMKIPPGYRPGGSQYFPATCGTQAAIVQMASNGDVSIWSSSPPAGRLCVCMPYCVE